MYNYAQAVSYLLEVPKFAKKNTLDDTKRYLRKLGSPQEQKKIIHVAGTNGKGSVCAYLASIVSQTGKRAGLFTSPHLIKINERFRINGEEISDELFLQAFNEVLKIAEQSELPHPTFFEFTFLMAMYIFDQEKVEYIILETGLGGRLDATNSVEKPIVTVITSISLDHTNILGKTVSCITEEKAGILKEGVPVIYDAGTPESERVIQKAALEKSCKMIPVSKKNMIKIKIKKKSIDFSLDSRYYGYIGFRINTPAFYQVVNAALAVHTSLETDLKEVLSVDMLQKALEETYWPGRMEEMLPYIIVDGSHNEGGIRSFLESVNYLSEKKPSILFYSAMQEKEYSVCIRLLCENLTAEQVIIAQLESERAVSADLLEKEFQKYVKCPIYSFPNTKEAFDYAWNQHVRENGSENKWIYCTGSLYLAGELRDVIRRYYRDKF